MSHVIDKDVENDVNYTYYVKALDGADHLSPPSDPVTVRPRDLIANRQASQAPQNNIWFEIRKSKDSWFF